VLQHTSSEDDEVVTRSLLATLKVLVNITHDNGMCNICMHVCGMAYE